jgi:hypothetical protein
MHYKVSVLQKAVDCLFPDKDNGEPLLDGYCTKEHGAIMIDSVSFPSLDQTGAAKTRHHQENENQLSFMDMPACPCYISKLHVHAP